MMLAHRGLKSWLREKAPSSVLEARYRMRAARKSRDQWLRAAMYKDLERELRALAPERLDAVEISGSQWAHLSWRSHKTFDFPEFDLCDPLNDLPAFDVVVCDQV